MFQNSFFYEIRNLQSDSYKSTIKTSYITLDNIRVNFCYSVFPQSNLTFTLSKSFSSKCFVVLQIHYEERNSQNCHCKFWISVCFLNKFQRLSEVQETVCCVLRQLWLSSITFSLSQEVTLWLDFKLSPWFEYCVCSFGYFPGVKL
jgi:hypothetical protein